MPQTACLFGRGVTFSLQAPGFLGKHLSTSVRPTVILAANGGAPRGASGVEGGGLFYISMSPPPNSNHPPCHQGGGAACGSLDQPPPPKPPPSPPAGARPRVTDQ